ncbi:hypothetical protein NQ095_17210 [Rossellomorea sp. SC111]|uniref:hypothetical protein n=1 Tax=Rossellomorea sp. SC111 TaxID=2968985 RepID=UPI00215A17BE|nr:hypothetical protein [Rossellomorea sp. SC111]MCR8850163.1 hypothetical protein [Rossellomorea sp. SC111]
MSSKKNIGMKLSLVVIWLIYAIIIKSERANEFAPSLLMMMATFQQSLKSV